MKKIINVILTLLLVFSLVGCQPTVVTNNNDFDAFVEKIVPEFIDSDDPNVPFLLSDPVKAGLEVSMPNYLTPDYQSYTEDIKKSQALLEKLQKFDYKSLTESQKITYDLLEYELTTNIKSQDFYYYNMGSLGSFLGTNCDLPYVFIAWPITSKTSLDQMLYVLENLPKTFQSYIDFEKARIENGLPRLKDIYNKIISQAQGVVEEGKNYFLYRELNKRVKETPNLTPEEVVEYQKRFADAITNGFIPAYDKLVVELVPLVEEGITDRNQSTLTNFPKGKEYYEFLLRSNVGTDITSDELYKYLNQKLIDTIKELRDLYKKEGDSKKEAKDVGEKHAFIERLMEITDNNFPSIKDPKFQLVEVDKSLQDNFSPAAYFNPLLDKDYSNLVLVNPSSHSPFIAKTLAHETYPGHMYQFNFVKESSLPLIRKIIMYVGYAEGWAKYADHYIYNMPEFADYLPAKLNAVNEDVVYLLWALIDVGINTKGWTIEDVQKLFSQYFGEMSLKDCEYYFDVVQENPTNMVQYYYSYFLLEDYKKEFKKAAGDKYSEEFFHQSVLEVGSVPFPILKKHLDSVAKGK